LKANPDGGNVQIRATPKEVYPELASLHPNVKEWCNEHWDQVKEILKTEDGSEEEELRALFKSAKEISLNSPETQAEAYVVLAEIASFFRKSALDDCSRWDDTNLSLIRKPFGYFFIEYLVKKDKLEYVKAAVQEGVVDVNFSDEDPGYDGTALMYLSLESSGNGYEIAEFLLKEGAKVDMGSKNFGSTPFMDVVLLSPQRDFNVCKKILELFKNTGHVDVDEKNPRSGDTALIGLAKGLSNKLTKRRRAESSTIQNNRKKMMSLLVDWEADPRLENRKGDTAWDVLDFASSYLALDVELTRNELSYLNELKKIVDPKKFPSRDDGVSRT